LKGSIKQDKYGWYFVVSDGKYPNGKRKQIKRTGFPTYEEAELALKEFHIESDGFNKIKKQMTNWKNIGHAGEKIVSADLILKNFVPFNSELPSSAVDLIALKNNKPYRIQVKTAKFNETGELKIGNLHKYSKNQLDILAAVDVKSKNVAYIKWSDIHPKSELTLYNKRIDGRLYFYDYLSLLE
jgi:hypothetical protein